MACTQWLASRNFQTLHRDIKKDKHLAEFLVFSEPPLWVYQSNGATEIKIRNNHCKHAIKTKFIWHTLDANMEKRLKLLDKKEKILPNCTAKDEFYIVRLSLFQILSIVLNYICTNENMNCFSSYYKLSNVIEFP